MAKNVRFGIIGSAGLIGNYHAGVLQKQDGPYELTALCDVDAERLTDQMERLKLPGTTDAAELVKLRFFAGLTMSEAASVLGLSERSAHRAWAYARAWLHEQIQRSP